jgi:hypothetical protein
MPAIFNSASKELRHPEAARSSTTSEHFTTTQCKNPEEYHHIVCLCLNWNHYPCILLDFIYIYIFKKPAPLVVWYLLQLKFFSQMSVVSIKTFSFLILVSIKTPKWFWVQWKCSVSYHWLQEHIKVVSFVCRWFQWHHLNHISYTILGTV